MTTAVVAFSRVCVVCGVETQLAVDRELYRRWRGGEYIQNVFPDLSEDERELMISGTHSECWDTLWKEEE